MRHGRGHHTIPPFELEDRSEFHPRKVLHDIENGLFVRCAAGNVRIAFFARKHDKTEGLYFLPERFVIHWLKPIHNIIYVFEFHDETIVPDRFFRMQIMLANQGNPTCPA